MWLLCCSVFSTSLRDISLITNVTHCHATDNRTNPQALLLLLLWSPHLTDPFWCFPSSVFHIMAAKGTAQVISYLKRRLRSDNQSIAELLMSKVLGLHPYCRWQKVGRWQSSFSNLTKNCPPVLKGTCCPWLVGEVPCQGPCCAQEKWSYFCGHTDQAVRHDPIQHKKPSTARKT